MNIITDLKRMAANNCCDISYIEDDDNRIKFLLKYTHEDFWSELLEYGRKNKIGWFTKNTFLYVYKPHKGDNRND